MHLEVREQGVELTDSARARLGRRLDFALGRLGETVSRVWAQFSDASADGGPATRCRMLVRMAHQRDVLVEDTQSDLNALIDHTSHLAGLAARRELARPH